MNPGAHSLVQVAQCLTQLLLPGTTRYTLTDVSVDAVLVVLRSKFDGLPVNIHRRVRRRIHGICEGVDGPPTSGESLAHSFAVPRRKPVIDRRNLLQDISA